MTETSVACVLIFAVAGSAQQAFLAVARGGSDWSHYCMGHVWDSIPAWELSGYSRVAGAEVWLSVLLSTRSVKGSDSLAFLCFT